jgi:hypothetical protein
MDGAPCRMQTMPLLRPTKKVAGLYIERTGVLPFCTHPNCDG